MDQRVIIVVDPNGDPLRKATVDEARAYDGQLCPPIFRRPVKFRGVTVDEWNGPGLSFVQPKGN